MAGFYVVAMTLTYAFFGVIAATIASIVLLLIARKRLPRGLEGRRSFLTASGLAPFAGLVWIVAALLIHVQISNRLAHQDCGFSGDPYVTLPNGYVLGSLNTYDGYIRAPGFNTDTPRTGPGYVRSLIDIQLNDGYFLGIFTDGAREFRFSFNTRDRSIQTFDMGIPISFEQVQTLVHQDANSYWNLYAQYRHHWPNYILAILIIGGEGAIAFALWKRWTTMHRRAVQVSINAPLPTPPQSPPESI
jgi:hypothetical protein